MPPKAKPAKRVKQDAERVSHPVMEAPLPETKELTGFLATLVSRSIQRSSSPDFADMVAVAAGDSHGSLGPLRAVWSDAIIGDFESAHTNIANENEMTIYRKLYHNLLVKGAVGAHVIHSPVWKQGKAPPSYPLSGALPATAVYSWKVRHFPAGRDFSQNGN